MSHIAISKGGRGGRRKRPWVFTEQGVAMLSSMLRSPTAVRVNIEIMRTFVRLRRLMATPGELAEQLMKLAETVQLHDDQIKVISQVLQQMVEKPDPPKRKIGFHSRDNDEKANSSERPTGGFADAVRGDGEMGNIELIITKMGTYNKEQGVREAALRQIHGG